MHPAAALGGITALALAGCSAAPALSGKGPDGPTPDRAALLAASCSGCHARVPAAGSAIPQIGGQAADDIQAKLLAFRDGKREGTLMPRLMRGYSDAEIELISEHLGAP
jgi:sulfide dehydrogenase cytochrome subunit